MENTSPDNCRWSNWNTTTDGSQAPPSLKVLSASDPLDRREHAFLISKDMKLWHNSFDGRWAGWSLGAAN